MMLSSCCHSSDSRVAKGYPFGDYQELEFTVYQTNCSNILREVQFIKNKAACDSLIRCNCSSINFNRNILVFLRGNGNQYAESGGFAPRVMINHKKQTYTIELRGYYKNDCSGSPRYNKLHYEELLLAPKPPDNYTLSFEGFNTDIY